ncbi:plasmid IncI1-type surface exclusion protein ExcA [Pseudomonas sp. W2-17]|uniref:plasmid IncI1-type surface exclusion protein ExcA n=1 Tax=Pseudomonas sp. W2-17 TaxID=3058039 RepID=UPI0034E0B126
MVIQRVQTSPEALLTLLRALYVVFGLPSFLLLTVASFLMAGGRSGQDRTEILMFGALMSLGVIIPIGFFVLTTLKRRRLLTDIVQALNGPDRFLPDAAHEVYSEGVGKYFGIDPNIGTILYVHRIRKGQVDVVGLNMADWTSRELEGKTLRLYTKFPTLPCIEISTPWAQRWYDTLGAMEYKRYNTPKPFSQYVSEHVEALERENNIHIPKLA